MAALVTAGTVALQAAPAAASTCGVTTDDWVGGVSTAWDDAGNWSAGHVPTATDDVCIAAPGTTVVIGGQDSAGSVISLTPVAITGTLTLPAADRSSSLTGLTLTGTLTGPGSVSLLGSSTWSRGKMTGTGTTTVSSGATLTVAGQYLSMTDRSLRNDGTLTLQGTLPTGGSGGIRIFDSTQPPTGGSPRLVNNGLLQMGTGSTLDNWYPAAGTLLNAGTILGVGTGTAYVDLPLSNEGMVAGSSGVRLSLRGGSAGTGPTGGTFSYVVFAGGRWTLGPDVVMADIADTYGYLFPVGDATWAGPVSMTDDALLQFDGTLTITGDLTMRDYSELDAYGTLIVGGTLDWYGGWLDGYGGISIARTGRFIAEPWSGSGLREFEGSLSNSGTAVVYGTKVELWNDSAIRNLGTFELRGDVMFTCIGNPPCPATLVNTGLLEKSAGTGTAQLPVLDNSGEVRVDSGTLEAQQLVGYSPSQQELSQGTYTLTGRLQVPGMAITTLSTKVTLNGPAAGLVDDSGADSLASLSRLNHSGTLSLQSGASATTAASVSSAGIVDIEDGSRLTTPALTLTTGAKLSGIGVIYGDVHNLTGEVSPGSTTAPDALSIAGNFDQGATGKLTIDESASGSDLLDVWGTAALGGTLALRTDATSRPAVGSSASLLDFADVSGAFAQLTGVDMPSSGGYYWLSRSSSELTATVHPVSDRPAGTVAINAGATYAKSTGVTLTIGMPAGMTVTGMRVANDAAPAGTWQAAATSLAWTLPTKNGAHTVQVQFRDAEGNTSAVAVATITLDTVAPIATITAPATPTSAAVVALSEAVSGVTADDVAIRDSTGATVAATRTCADGTGATVACTATTVRTVRVLPSTALARGVSYTVVVNPSTATGRIVDKAGNAAATTSTTFTL
ncbi:MAG: hypothetical protein ACJ74O_16940 [Frankiaceae bacterium]